MKGFLLKGRAGLLGTVRQWHWISSAMCLVGMLMFAITGITLNHAADIPVEPVVITKEAILPEAMLEQLELPDDDRAPLPPFLRDWLSDTLDTRIANQAAEWSDDEIYLSLPRPGGDAWLTIDLLGGEVQFEKTDRGWVSYFNDLHKGRHTGVVWFWFIDVFSVACVIFSITGLVLLARHAGSRPSTWPLVGAGLVLPLVLILLFIH
ncbi:PepSY-associated TM helix domain-containing protein [Cellvibrio polysaccharolyticus]|uniref:Uncharacterized protein n=1 Tax=Cellvibrio polysaccharolyticus TaxID=2082724 RepID=A0A928YUS4_9GAMM|nr:PepSY-associated TM helix domain-containing protein [Cellvibrio polysaccharolyticus]MBE8717780.1 hypothetical protein [Cellvibrio polysaccharolyticus]